MSLLLQVQLVGSKRRPRKEGRFSLGLYSDRAVGSPGRCSGLPSHEDMVLGCLSLA